MSSEQAKLFLVSKYMNIELVVGGMTCRRWVREVTSRLRDVPGVERVTANRPAPWSTCPGR
jgi:hypothetical protein